MVYGITGWALWQDNFDGKTAQREDQSLAPEGRHVYRNTTGQPFPHDKGG